MKSPTVNGRVPGSYGRTTHLTLVLRASRNGFRWSSKWFGMSLIAYIEDCSDLQCQGNTWRKQIAGPLVIGKWREIPGIWSYFEDCMDRVHNVREMENGKSRLPLTIHFKQLGRIVQCICAKLWSLQIHIKILTSMVRHMISKEIIRVKWHHLSPKSWLSS